MSALVEWRYHSYSKGMAMSKSEASLKPVRNQLIGFRVSPQERDRLHSRAEQAGLRNSEFIRRAAFSAPIASHTDLEMVRELRRLGAMLKHLYPKNSNWTSAEKERYWTAMNQITGLAAKLQAAIKKG